MTPNTTTLETQLPRIEGNQPKLQPKRRELAWKKIFFFAYLHYGAIFGLYYYFVEASWWTCLWTYFVIFTSTQGVGAGTHRLWAHRTYKARLPLRILLAFYQTIAFQKDIYDWVRDHRIHHKYSDTECDPHNATNGFFYSHIGWLMLKKEDCVMKKGRALDLSDLEADPVVMFQRKYYWYVAPILAFLMPASVPWYFWNESFQISWYTCALFRYCITLHGTCLVNSAAHILGNRPYDKNILPTQNLFVSYVTNGEGFHNYHHAFAWDYKAAELGTYHGNLTTALIDFMARIGWAYDLKSVPLELVERRARRTGDGSWKLTEDNTWGWGDKDMNKEDMKKANITYRGESTMG